MFYLRRWIPKLGGASAFIGKFGDDEFGHMLVDILKQHGVNADGVCFDEHARTALAFVTLRKDGEREFMFYRNPSADMLLKKSELNMGLIKQAKIFHYGPISLISEPCRSAHIAAMKAAKDAGILLSYDPNVRLPLWSSPQACRDGIMSIWTEADFIKVSDDEVAFLTNGDADNEEVVLSLWYDGLKLLVVTDGEKGCRYFTKNEEKLKESLIFANACGALSTTQKGAIPALPDKATALELIANSKGRYGILGINWLYILFKYIWKLIHGIPVRN